MKEQIDTFIPVLPVSMLNNIAEFMKEHDGCNISINFNNADGLNGYGHIMWCSVHISMVTRTCQRCGYDPLWHPDEEQSKCLRHTYDSWRYDDVFIWRSMLKEGHINISSLERAFDIWLKAQPKQCSQATKLMIFNDDMEAEHEHHQR